MVLRKAPGVTRWVPWNWTADGGVCPVLQDVANGGRLRREGEAVEYHAGTRDA